MVIDMEDLTYGLEAACLMDVKMGLRTFHDDLSAEDQVPRKDMLVLRKKHRIQDSVATLERLVSSELQVLRAPARPRGTQGGEVAGMGHSLSQPSYLTKALLMSPSAMRHIGFVGIG